MCHHGRGGCSKQFVNGSQAFCGKARRLTKIKGCFLEVPMAKLDLGLPVEGSEPLAIRRLILSSWTIGGEAPGGEPYREQCHPEICECTHPRAVPLLLRFWFILSAAERRWLCRGSSELIL